MKMYLTRKYIGVKIITILGICAITFAITSCNSKQTVITTDNATSASQASTANKPIMSDPETTQTTNTINTYYTIADNNDTTLCAIYYLGYSQTQAKENAKELISSNNMKLSLDSSEDIEQVILDGNEWYLILPKYVDTQISVSTVELNNMGDLVPTEDILSTTKPILLQCNPSDIVPSSQVSVTYDKDSITFYPSLSLKDGDVTPVERAYTKSMISSGLDMEAWNALLADIYNVAPGTAGCSLKSVKVAGELLDWLEDYAQMTDMDTLKNATKTWLSDNKDTITTMEDLVAAWSSVANDTKAIITDRTNMAPLLDDAGYTLQHDQYTENYYDTVSIVLDDLFLA